MILRRTRRPAPRGWMVDRLAERLEPLEAVLFDAPDTGLLAVDRAGRVVRANAWLRRLLNVAAEPRAGAAARELFVPADRDRVRAFLDDAASGARAAEPLQAHMPAADGTDLPVTVTAQVLREPDQAISGLLLRIADQSSALRLEAELAHGQKLQAVGQLAAGIAHDFNNLLTAVLGSADAALDRPGIDPETRGDLRQIRLAGERGSALVRQLLAFSRRQPLQPRIVAVNDAVRALAELLPRMLGAPHRLALELEEPGRRIRVDPAQFDQILVNLSMNARDAMPKGGTLTLRTGHRTVYRPQQDGLETISPGRYVLIEATDTGIGIAPEILPHIFEPFFTTRRQSGGSGLGLSTVHGIVRQSGGFVTVDSRLAEGTTIRVYLPRHEGGLIDEPAVEQLPVPVDYDDMARGIVLLVEDEPSVRRLAERALHKAGWTVLAVDSAESALLHMSTATAPSIALLISDIVLPGMDGAALLARLRADQPNLPAILVSGYADSAVRGDLPLDGVVFLPKPYALKALVAAATTTLLTGVSK